MKKFSEKLAEILGPIANKFSSQKYLVAIRDGFITVMPLVIIASFFVLINNVILDSTNGILKSLVNLDQYKEIGVSVYNGTLGFLSIFLAFGVAYKLADHYEMDQIGTGFIGVASTVALMPALDSAYTSPTGLFVAILGSILSTELLRIFQKSESLKIKMPESVPPTVAKSFNLLLPATITLTIFGIVAFVIIKLTGIDIYEIITNMIQTPLKNAFQTLPGIIIVIMLQGILWSFGLHGSFVLSPITEPTLLTAIDENIKALEAHQVIPNIVTKPFLDAFVNMGGTGTTIGLVIALLIFTKKESDKAISKLAFAPSCFNINEPLMFGLPVVLNPIYTIPLVFIPVVCLVISYFATAVGLVDKTVALVPWTTPPIISGFLATGGDWRAAVLSIVLIALSVALYMPFVIAANNMKDEY